MRLLTSAYALVSLLASTNLVVADTTMLGGVNLSGAEFNPGTNKRLNFDYVYPGKQEFDYFASKGFKLVRLPFDLNRLYPQPYADLAPSELHQIEGTVRYAASKGMRIVLDPHNYGFINDARTGQSRLIGQDPEGTKLFVDFWSRTARAFKSYPNVIFGLMNEPYKQTPTEWRDAAVKAVTAIRDAGAKQMIFIPGTFYTGAHSWDDKGGNGEAWADYQGDPAHNFAFEMHQYLDANNSGTHPQCAAGSGSSRLLKATAWLKRNKARGFLGEFAWSSDQTCEPEKLAFMEQLKNNRKLWIGWAWWAGGPWWPANYPFNINPTDRPASGRNAKDDKPQMIDLTQHLLF